VPVFNGERYLEEALRSILGQAFDDLEVVISDNASTDRTPEICRDYAARDPRVRYYRNEHNLGGDANYNRVAQLARGEYFKWAACDDLIAPEFVAQCVRVLDRSPQYALCTSRVAFIDEQGAPRENLDEELSLDAPRPRIRFREFLCKNHWALQMYGLIRSSVLRRLPPLGGYIGSDRTLLSELILAGPFYEVPERLLRYRRHHMLVLPARMVWWGAGRGHAALAFPVWRRFFAYFAMIGRARLSWLERLACYAVVAEWLLGSRWMSGRWRLLARDLLIAAGLVVGWGRTPRQRGQKGGSFR